jgi:hypothetical protein
MILLIRTLTQIFRKKKKTGIDPGVPEHEKNSVILTIQAYAICKIYIFRVYLNTISYTFNNEKQDYFN